jgi:NADPH:quinone reductase-like Zn-dependent oxidoreductase
MNQIHSQAFYLTKYGSSDKAFELKNITVESPKENEYLIEVESFGLNYADVMARNNLYREAPPLPCVIGYEVVGKVIATGKNTNSNFLGKRVVSFTRFGGYSKHVNVPEYACVEIDDMEANIALALATQYVTAYYMCEYLSPVRENNSVLIHAAAGGVGSALIQLCKLKNAQVFAKVSSAEKEKYVKKIGADYAINYHKLDYEAEILRHLKGKRLDISFNPFGGKSFKKDMRLLGSDGKLFLFGGSELSGKKLGVLSSINFIWNMGFLLPISLMMKSKSILGVNMLKIADNKPEIISHCLKSVLTLYQENKITIELGREFPSSKLSEGHSFLESGKSIGKISINWV